MVLGAALIFFVSIQNLAGQGIGTIVTVAGNGGTGFSGDGGQSTNASFNTPVYVAVGHDGTLYIVDWFNNRIRKVAPTGIITTVAGNGTAGFSGDGGPATSASLNQPLAVELDGQGNLYIADAANSRIRKVDAAGTISTAAGNGIEGFAGDNGPAVNAELDAPTRLALDIEGNLFIADQNNMRIRRVDAVSGVITTVAGSGPPGRFNGAYSGDGGLATSARFNHPTAVDLDSSGNIYVSDQLNHVVRKVNTAGIISTFAGNGIAAFNGDGGLATNASLNDPAGLAMDAAGNLYIGDNVNERVRRVDPSGLISTVVGNGSSGFTGDRGPAVTAEIDNPFGVALDDEGNLYVADTGNQRVRKVFGGVPGFRVSPLGLSFNTTPDSAPSTQSVTLVSAAAINWTAGPIWIESSLLLPPGLPSLISLSAGSGTTPSTLSVTVNPASYPAGKYRADIPIQSAQGTAHVIADITIAASAPSAVGVDTPSFTTQAPVGTSPPPRTFQIMNAGGGTVNWTAQASTITGGNWLSVSPGSGSATSSSPATVQVQIASASLQPGTYTGAIVISNTANGQSVKVGVSLIVLASAPVIQLDHTGLLFTALEGDSQTLSQGLKILNPGSIDLNWSIQITTLASGSWLQVSPASGHSDAAGATFPEVQVTVDPSALFAGQYYGFIRVVAPGAVNTPQTATVHVNVLARWKTPPAIVEPQALLFTAQAGVAPPSQALKITNASATNVQATLGVQTLNGGNWLQVSAPSFPVPPLFPSLVLVSASTGSLAPGTYRGQITVQFSDGSPAAVVNVLLVLPSASSPAPARVVEGGAACSPTRLLMVITTIGSNFQLPVGWPSSVDAAVVDDCGNPVSNATVVASFSNGDPTLVLQSLFNGTYAGTWKPANTGNSVTISARASLPPLADAVASVGGSLQTNASAPILFSNGLVNAASFAPAAPLSPGGIVSVFGRALASSDSASKIPLPTTLGGAVLNIGGLDSPLFFSSDGQLNVQLPAELPPNSSQIAYVRVRSTPGGPEAITVPEPVTLGNSHPGLFSTNQQGTGQGAILNTNGILVDASAPAAAGDTIELFATGLGATSPAVPSGQGAPGAEPLARVVANVQANIAGQNAHVDFAGLAPNFVGLYQVNVVVPPGIAPGAAVPVFITVDGVPSNTVTIATK